MASEPAVRSANEIADDLSGSLSESIQNWYNQKDHSLSSWRSLMRKELAEPLEDHLLGPYSRSLAARGISPLGTEQARFIVVRALTNTDDMYKRLLDAPSVGTLTASPWFVETLLSKAHQSRVVSSLVRVVQGIFGQRAIEVDERFTGRKRWRTSVTESRHRDLEGVVRDAGETFNVNGFDWQMPRQDASNGPQASGCLCYLEYQTIDGRWV